MRSSPLAPLAIWAATILLLACALLACGGNNHSLQSVAVTPAVAASSKAQFTATGIYGTMPTSVDITSTATWCQGSSEGVCQADVAGQVYVSAGLAQCDEGATGAFMILAGQPSGPPPGMNQGFTLKPFGSAQLTCP